MRIGKVFWFAGGAAIIILACGLYFVVMVLAIGGAQAVIPPSLSYLAIPLVFILVAIIRKAWPERGRQIRERLAIAKLRKIGRHRPYGVPPDEFGLVNSVMGQAAQLPPMDAAFHLWINKDDLDSLEGFNPPPKQPSGELTDSKVSVREIRQAICKVQADYDTAHFGTTFLRLEKLYPRASRKELQESIRAAVKLDRDCTRNFSYKSEDYFDDLKQALEAAKETNPGFQESTYEAAYYKLARVMR